MDIVIGKTAGFCFGVKNAVDNTEKELKNGKKVYCLGELVHNKQVTQDLTSKGAIFIEKIEDAKNMAIIRAHGVPKSVYEQAKKMNIKLKDLTCPKVLNIHNLALEYSNNGYYIFLIGKKLHPETLGSVSFCGEYYSLIENVSEVKQAIKDFSKSKLEKSVVLVQTTFNLDDFNTIVKELQKEIEDIEVKNTICISTRLRQEETLKISQDVDCMIIIGGKHSSNSNELYEIAKENCKHVFFVESSIELDIEKIKRFEKIGIMAGASTSQKSIEEIVDIIKKTC